MEQHTATTDESSVLRLADCDTAALSTLLAKLGLAMHTGADDTAIPGSFWGDDEAGLIGNTLHVRGDTPLHSALHESGHYVCMAPERRAVLDTNAGGTFAEENAVCYWQVAVTDHLPGVDRQRMFADMDAWGYTFRLGSTQAWFEDDAEDAREWLASHDLIAADGRIRLQVRA